MTIQAIAEPKRNDSPGQMAMFLEGSGLKQGIKLWVGFEIAKGKLHILVSIVEQVSGSLLYMSPPPKNPPGGGGVSFHSGRETCRQDTIYMPVKNVKQNNLRISIFLLKISMITFHF